MDIHYEINTITIQLDDEQNGLPQEIRVLSGHEDNDNVWVYTLKRTDFK